MSQMTAFYPLVGGLDLVSPAISIPAGRVTASLNYEPAPRGYRRSDGYERFDGHAKPSEASYWILNFDQGSAAISEGETVTGGMSSATGEALIDAVVTSGSYGGGDAAGYVVLTAVSGTFQDDEAITTGGGGAAVADGTATQRGAETDANDMTWLQDAIETARADISTVPGSGNMLGVWVYGGNVYAVRNNAGGTAAVMHKATTSGWSAVDLGLELAFTSGGTTEIAEGDTITGATSSATADVERVVLTSGSWAGGDAAGYLYLSNQSGTFQAENLDVGASTNLATIASDSSALALPAGGRYEFINHNFYGASDLRRMYGVNGVGRGFEFDGTVFVPIRTGMATDVPLHLAAHKNQLFFAFAGGSLQNSGIGDPLDWTILSGANEIGIGEEITALLSDVSGVLIVFGRNNISVLYGSDSSDFALTVLADDAGGVEWSVQRIGTPVYLDDRGLRSLSTTQAFGDFKVGTLTQMIHPLFEAKRAAGVSAIASVRVRAKDQYRLFWDDGTGLFIYFGRKQPEILAFDLGKTVYAICSAEDSSGNEIIFFGSSDGYVYQLDKGTSFDGEEVNAFVRLPFNHVGTPTQEKRWHKATVEVDAGPGTALAVIAEFSYGNPDQPATAELDFTVRGSGGFWDEANWDNFYWSSPVEGLAEAYIDGIGRNVSLVIVSSTTYDQPYAVHGLTLHFSYRRLVR